VHGFRCYDNIAPNANCQRVLVLALRPAMSVQDVLENEQVKLDNMFKFSLMQDIVRVSASHVTYLQLSHSTLLSSNSMIWPVSAPPYIAKLLRCPR